MAEEKVISTNRKAFHDYAILETYEAGLVLKGTEVKSLREAQVNFKDSYATIDNDEAWLVGCYISPYHHGTDRNSKRDEAVDNSLAGGGMRRECYLRADLHRALVIARLERVGMKDKQQRQRQRVHGRPPECGMSGG